MTDSGVDRTEAGVDVALLMRARRRLSALVVQLEVAPFSEETVAAMRAYLDQDAGPAQDQFARWAALSKPVRDGLAAQLRQAAS